MLKSKDWWEVNCRKCGSDKIFVNRASTTFCKVCNICVSRVGKPERLMNHPLREKFGYRIAKHHPDASEYSFSLSGYPRVKS